MLGKIQDAEIFRIDDSYLEEQVKAVSMGEIETTTDSKKVLFTFGLFSCIGIYIYSKNFGILGHLDLGDLYEKHFEYKYKQINNEWVRIRGKFKQTGEIIYEITQNFKEIIPPLKIGMVIGADAFVSGEEQIRKINYAIDSIIRVVENMGLSIEKQDPIISSMVIVDTENLLLKTKEPKQEIGKIVI